MSKFALCSMLLVALLSLQACNTDSKSKHIIGDAEQSDSNASIIDDDISDFMNKAASGGMMEMQLGEMAEQSSKSQGVKNFGIMMVKDHTKATAELRTLAAKKDISLPSVVSEDHQKHINELTPLRGAEFDEKYMDMMVEDHKEDIDLFEKASKSEDQDISAFAAKTLPVLKKHFEAAKKIERNLTM
jgi:putative membrane protein